MACEVASRERAELSMRAAQHAELPSGCGSHASGATPMVGPVCYLPSKMLAEASTAQGGDVLSRSLERFGFSSLRPGQADVITDIFAGRPVIAVMPTGAGKSLCYQLPAIVLGERGGVTLVVSPLIALMKDQVDALRNRGIAACALTSAAGAEEQRDILDGIRAGMYTLVYVAPERFRSPRFVDALRATASKI